MAIRREEVENPVTLPHIPFKPQYMPQPTTACDVCGEWEATVQFKHTKLCDECASEEGIKVL